MDTWVSIPSFPGYSISDQGQIRNDGTDRIITPRENQGRTVYVSMYKDGRLFARSLAKMVAHAFVPRPRSSLFDTPIHLDGNKYNNRANNLMWRPRWFAAKFHQQFESDWHRVDALLQDLDSGYQFVGPMQPAMRYGLLAFDVMQSAVQDLPVFPTKQKFIFIKQRYTIPQQSRGL